MKIKENAFYVNNYYLKEVYEQFGYDVMPHLGILQEECAELIQAASKYRRADDENSIIKAKNKFIEELAHVVTSSLIVANLLSIQQADIDLEVNRKVAKYNFPSICTQGLDLKRSKTTEKAWEEPKVL